RIRRRQQHEREMRVPLRADDVRRYEIQRAIVEWLAHDVEGVRAAFKRIGQAIRRYIAYSHFFQRHLQLGVELGDDGEVLLADADARRIVVELGWICLEREFSYVPHIGEARLTLKLHLQITSSDEIVSDVRRGWAWCDCRHVGCSNLFGVMPRSNGV